MSTPPTPPASSEPFAPPTDLILVTTPFVSGYHVTRVIGTTFGLIVRSRGLGQNIGAYFRSPEWLVGYVTRAPEPQFSRQWSGFPIPARLMEELRNYGMWRSGASPTSGTGTTSTRRSPTGIRRPAGLSNA
ncbi:MAG: heavy metal-binding domain-containing protein [Thermoplasmata archaeon]